MSVLTAEERERCLMAATRRHLEGRMTARAYRAAELSWGIDHRAMFLDLAYRRFAADEAREVSRQIDVLLEEWRALSRLRRSCRRWSSLVRSHVPTVGRLLRRPL